jgi:Uma2 family endonuclease
MDTTQTREQAHWNEIVADPALRDLPYKVETNAQGQLILSPHRNRHSMHQEAIQDLLREHAPPGRTPPEFAIATPEGVKTPDVVWMSPQRWEKMQATGDPTTLAPEICVEVMSASNTDAEMQEKRALYRSVGAEEVWVVDEEGQIRFYADDALEASHITPECPNAV